MENIICKGEGEHWIYKNKNNFFLEIFKFSIISICSYFIICRFVFTNIFIYYTTLAIWKFQKKSK